MAEGKPLLVTVEAVKDHTTSKDNRAYAMGERYEVEESDVPNLERLGMARRVAAADLKKAPAPARDEYGHSAKPKK